jgi:hypothetical protein
LPRRKMLGSIGTIDRTRHARLLRNLSKHLTGTIGKAPDQ